MKMKRNIVPICSALLVVLAPCARAGSVTSIANGAEATGKVTFGDATSLHVSGVSSSTTNLSDVLQANFLDTPFQIDYWSTDEQPKSPPAIWKPQDIGEVASPGSFTYANGVFTLNSTGKELPPKTQPDHSCFFLGQQWTGDGQWIARVTGIDCDAPQALTGLMLRQSLDEDTGLFALGAMPFGAGALWYRQTGDKRMMPEGISMDLPIWLRLRKDRDSVDASTSGDGKTWTVVEQKFLPPTDNPWVGLWVRGGHAASAVKGTIDHVTFSPREARVPSYAPGLLLKSGSLLAGTLRILRNQEATLGRNGGDIVVPTPLVAAVIWQPATPQQILDAGSQTGVLMKNGDFLAGDIETVTGASVKLSSVLLGDVAYNPASTLAVVMQGYQPQASDYEVRLKDGSILQAKGFGAVSDTEVTINDISGLDINVTPDEIVRIRAGASRVQPLVELPWTSTPPKTADKDADTTVRTWIGSNGEQIMVVPAGTAIDFPAQGKFRAAGFSVALAPDAAPNAQTVVHILADGKELGKTPPFKAGDQPRFVEVSLPRPATLTLEAESATPETKVLFVDPLGIR
jgi:hypothetical protein